MRPIAFQSISSRLACTALCLAATAITSVAVTRADQPTNDQATDVQVSLPRVMTASFTSVMPGPTPGTKYVVINMLRVPNISTCGPLNVDYKDFALRARDGDLYYVDRAVTAKLPFSLSEGVLGPHQAETGSLAFQVPASLRDAWLVYYVDACDAVYFSY